MFEIVLDKLKVCIIKISTISIITLRGKIHLGLLKINYLELERELDSTFSDACVVYIHVSCFILCVISNLSLFVDFQPFTFTDFPEGCVVRRYTDWRWTCELWWRRFLPVQERWKFWNWFIDIKLIQSNDLWNPFLLKKIPLDFVTIKLYWKCNLPIKLHVRF